MHSQRSDDTVPWSFITDADNHTVIGRPPATGAWRDGDPAGQRKFENLGEFTFEAGGAIPNARIAFETWGQLSEDRDNAILIPHALTGDSHVRGPAGPGHHTAGWWEGIVGPDLAIDTNRYYVVAPNMLGGCQGSTGPASFAPDGYEWATRFPYTTIRDQVVAQAQLADRLGIQRWAAVIGGSMGGMHALEWGVMFSDRVSRLGILAAPPFSTADQIAQNTVQIEAVQTDPRFNGGRYYDAADGDGPYHGLALARRLAMISYRSPHELNARFGRTWQSEISPLGAGGRFAVESYIDFHGNKFTRRFDANSYTVLLEAMNSHDVGRGRGGVELALQNLSMPTIVLGIDSDRLFPVEGQNIIAAAAPGNITGDAPVVISSPFGHDAFLIENDEVSSVLENLLTRSALPA